MGRWYVPVVLVREVQKTAGDAALLKDVEDSQALRDGETVVFVAMDDELGGAEFQDPLGGGGIPAAVVVTGTPKGTVELDRKSVV